MSPTPRSSFRFERGTICSQVARDLGLIESVVSRWVQKAEGRGRRSRPQGFGPLAPNERDELARLSIKVFYNPQRRHSTLGYLSPAQFQTQAAMPIAIRA